MKIKSVKVVAKHTVDIIETELSPLKDNQVLIKVLACGICSTEMAVFNGDTIGVEGCSFHYKSYPANLGHEAVGYVEEVGPKVRDLKVGDAVTGMTYSGCAYAEFIIEPEDMLIKINDSNKDNHHKYILEPLMATTNIIHQLKISYGDSIAIIGDGYMSMILVCALSKYPLKDLIVVGHHDWRLDLMSKYGATSIINSKTENAWEIINEKTYGKGVDISVEYAGTTESLALSASICKAKVRSQLVMASSYSNDTPFIIANYLQNRAPILVPAYPHTSFDKQKDMERAMWALESGIFPVDSLMTHNFGFNNIQEAFELNQTRQKGFIKGTFFPKDL
jgi:threonine dehydrogenase-like Zn-dependent dehydrogenase